MHPPIGVVQMVNDHMSDQVTSTLKARINKIKIEAHYAHVNNVFGMCSTIFLDWTPSILGLCIVS